MATIHGKDGVFYLQGSGAEAVPLTQRANWTIDFDADDAVAFHQGDTWEAVKRGARRFSGSMAGSLDAASDVLWQAFTATSGRKAYWYPDVATSARYYYGTIWPKFGISADSGAIESFSGTFVNADSTNGLSLN